MQVKKQCLEPNIETLTSFKLGQEYNKAVYCHPAYLTYADYIIRNTGLDEAQAVIKLIIQKTKIMVSGPITSWQIDGETVVDFIFLGSKITTDDDCSQEIKDPCSWKEIYDQRRQLI